MIDLTSEILCNIAIRKINQNMHNNISLFHGYSGDLLLIFELYNTFHCDFLLNYRNRLLKEINNSIKECKSFNFRDGFSGLLYTYAYLDNNNFIETTSDLYDQFDKYFIEHINTLCKVKDYDLLHGLIGYGIYYIDTAKKQNEKKKLCK